MSQAVAAPAPVTVDYRGFPNDLLHRVVREELPRLVHDLGERGRTLPGYVVSELERFCACADPVVGFAHLVCDPEEDPDDAQVLLMAASMEGRSALRGRRTRRRGIPRNPEDLPQRCAAYEGYNLHAGVRISSRERPALERLCRYVLRPPLSKARLEETTEGDIRLTLKRPWSSGPGRGTAEMHFTRQEFLERLCAPVPPPKSNTIIYNGVLAAHSALRSEVVPVAPPQPHPKRPGIRLVLEGKASEKSRAWSWAGLLQRVFSVDGFACPHRIPDYACASRNAATGSRHLAAPSPGGFTTRGPWPASRGQQGRLAREAA